MTELLQGFRGLLQDLREAREAREEIGAFRRVRARLALVVITSAFLCVCFAGLAIGLGAKGKPEALGLVGAILGFSTMALFVNAHRLIQHGSRMRESIARARALLSAFSRFGDVTDLCPAALEARLRGLEEFLTDQAKRVHTAQRAEQSNRARQRN